VKDLGGAMEGGTSGARAKHTKPAVHKYARRPMDGRPP
jgi:hypothetical protein